MRILATTFVYNERKYLPAWVNYYRSLGCEIFVLDNFSDDGTYEWLKEQNIPCDRIDTGGAFELQKLQQALMIHIARIKPDWVIYAGADLYLATYGGLVRTIEEANFNGYNLLELQHYEVMNTGEDHNTPLQNYYFYCTKLKRLRMVGKYGPGFRILADEIIQDVSGAKIFHSSGILVNYGMCKTREEREKTFERRRKAWAEGMHAGWGTHYEPASKRNWIWSKSELVDIRTLPIFNLVVTYMM